MKDKNPKSRKQSLASLPSPSGDFAPDTDRVRPTLHHFRDAGSVGGPEVVVFAGNDEFGCCFMAATWFAMLADSRKAQAIVAGSKLPSRIQAHLVTAMQESGLSLDAVRTAPMTTDLLRSADLVVTMGDSFKRSLLVPRSGIEPGHPLYREHWLMESGAAPTDALGRTRYLRDVVRSRVAMLIFTEGWDRADLSREAARVTRPRGHNERPATL